MPFLLTLLLSVLITIALIPPIRALVVRYGALDVPNERKVHATPIPRAGGVAMAVAVFVPVVAWGYADGLVRGWLAGSVVLVVAGMIDDFRGLSPKAKFVGQAAAAMVAIFVGGVEIRSLGALLPDGVVLPSWLSVPLTLLAIVGVTNAINLSDGLDGLAGGIGLLSFCCIGYLAWLTGDRTVGLMAVALAGCIFGFLRFNTHPATVFMGDAGSQFLGFSAAALSIALTQGDTPLSPLLPLIILGFPILDTNTVMLTRIARGGSPFVADRNHFHHNLLGLGLLHPEAVLTIYVLQTLLIVSAVTLRFHSEWVLLAGYLVFSGLILGLFSRARRTGWKFRRFDLLDVVILGNLRRLRDDGTIIKVMFRMFEVAIPLLIFFTSFLSTGGMPGYFPYVAVVAVGTICAVWRFRKENLGTAVRIALYLLIPFAVYLSEVKPVAWLDGGWRIAYNASFGLFAAAIVLISKFTRRKQGFRNTPLDFLVLLLALVAPNLPEVHAQDFRLGIVAAKIIMLYFSFEVLMAEARGRFGKIALSTMASLLVLAIR